MNPIGLTRAEEESEHAPTVSTPDRTQAPEGILACAVVVPPGVACGAAAETWIRWPRDPEAAKTPACRECGGRMREIARSHGSDVALEPL
jgi:hypothetical protein